MSTIKSFSVGNGDMFYIDHNTDNFTIIDCCYENEEQRERLFERIKQLSKNKGITRFISTHPDEDHIKGLEILDKMIGIRNFYVVENKATRKDDETDSFIKYRTLRDDRGKKAFYVFKGCYRKWMNRASGKNDEERRGSSGINYLWPDTSNSDYKEALERVKKGEDTNNISPIFTYSLENGIVVMWMGDMEASFLEKIKNEINWPKVDVLFAPHHGRKSGHVSRDVLDKLAPKVIVIGEAPSKDLDYYIDYETIKQNSAGDITFIAKDGVVDVYVENTSYGYPVNSFCDNGLQDTEDGKYLGSFTPYAAE